MVSVFVANNHIIRKPAAEYVMCTQQNHSKHYSGGKIMRILK